VSHQEPTAFERVREAVVSLDAPGRLPTIATAASVHPVATEACLSRLVDDGAVVTANRRGDVVYYPDPVTRYVGNLEDALAPVDDERLRSVRQAVSDWRSFDTALSLSDLEAYDRGGQLVASALLPAGRHVYDDDWDVLVVLDTCRVDALRQVAPEFDLFAADDVEADVSRGSQTAEWLSATFTGNRVDVVGETGYVAGNGWVTGVFVDGLRPDDDLPFHAAELPTEWDVVDAEQFGALVEAWRLGPGEYSRDTPWDPHPTPRTVTDHAIALGRRRDLDRLVVHYKQPHAPYTEAARREGRTRLTPAEGSPRAFIEDGGDPSVVWEAYTTDLRAALREVAVLCENVDGRVAVTADHGEAFGEDGELGHYPAMLHPTVKEVPWVEVDGSDEGARAGATEAVDASLSAQGDDGEPSEGLEDHLESLGYR
jgi:hypothetical protein